MAAAATSAALSGAPSMAAGIVSSSSTSPALGFKILAECSKSKARTSLMKLPHYAVELPMFMPVGTQGTMKGLLPQQVKDANAQLILGNTYHLGTRPGKELLNKFEGLHNFMQWDRALLTDSGGFQMVSLLELAEITEEGVKFRSPYDGSECMLTPEESIEIQNAIGADIMMQLDDVVDVRETDYERFKTATYRTTRWLDRCMKANKNPDRQNLFPIIQGGIFPDLRKISLEQLIARDAPGYAIGGLSGGEDKNKFWPTIHLCTDHLPKNKPRYCMGVGFAVDLVVCCAMGVDMFDCVFPTRTARFGCALVDNGQINLKSREFMNDFIPIDEKCDCSTCQNYTRAYLHTIVTKETVACHLLSIHNIAYQMRLMKNIRESIKKDCFVEFVQDFMAAYYKNQDYPQWVTDCLAAVNITLKNDSTQRTPSAVLEDLEDNEDSLWDLRSDFEKLSHTGYRNAILGDFEKEEAEGRLKGFQKAFQLDSNINPTSLLSRIDGFLFGCLIKCNLSEEQVKEVSKIQAEIKQSLELYYKPNSELFEKIMTDSDDVKGMSAHCSDECDCSLNISKVVIEEKIMSIVDRTKTFSKSVGWSLPPNI